MTLKDVLDANFGLKLAMLNQAKRMDGRNARAVNKMREIVKATKKGGDAVVSVRVNDYDIADITAFLRDLASQRTTGTIMDTVARNPGMIHGD